LLRTTALSFPSSQLHNYCSFSDGILLLIFQHILYLYKMSGSLIWSISWFWIRDIFVCRGCKGNNMKSLLFVRPLANGNVHFDKGHMLLFTFHIAWQCMQLNFTLPFANIAILFLPDYLVVVYCTSSWFLLCERFSSAWTFSYSIFHFVFYNRKLLFINCNAACQSGYEYEAFE
jgi:hypothetical protein